MVIVKIKGGLGNQLFQYAFGLYLKKILSVPVKFDLSWFNYRDFNFELGRLGFDLSLSEKSETTRIFRTSFSAKIARFLKRHTPFKTRLISDADPKVFLDEHYYDGYWQQFEYVEKSLLELKTIIKASKNEMGATLIDAERKGRVAIHIRGGDFFKSENHSILGVDYYKSALADLRKKECDLTYFVFTNDITYSNELLQEMGISSFEIASSDDPIVDFLKMSNCEHFIIANSTYSWWAALLGAGESSKVYLPSAWAQGTEKFKGETGLNNWVRI